jgi:hypothetical protein
MNITALAGLFANRLKGICVLLFACFSFIFNTSAQFSRSDESVATSIYIVMLNTTWENQSSFQTFQIGVLDSDTSFYSIVRKKYEGIALKGKRVSVVHFKNQDAITPTQILCVDKKFNKKIEKIAKAITGNQTLLITNSCKDDDYTMVNFNGRLKKDDFTVNQTNMEKAGLKLTNQFEEYMEGTVQWEDLLTESMDKLEKEREKVAEKEQTISVQKTRINYQRMTLDENAR